MSQVRVRFAPSPTGYLHIGGLRTALYNYLYAMQQDGKFILRIEDTDRTRFVEGAIENLIHELNWSKVSVNEGVSLNDEGKIIEIGDKGPYIQSERVAKDLYRKYADKLIEQGDAYYCFCTPQRLEDLRNQQRADGLIPRYDGLCRGVSLENAKERIAAGEPYVIRQKLPADRDVVVEDKIKGNITINTRDMDDQVLIKSDGFPTYHFAVVVDDHLMEISHIVRGDEWISSTPKHILLYQAFGWPIPEYIHLPTVLNKSGKKLSKRNDDVSVEDFRKQGYLAEGLINYLALVGWSPPTTQEILSLDELIEQFSFDRVQKAGGVFDINKLNWVNAHYIKKLPVEELAGLIKPYLLEAGLIDEESKVDLELVAETFHDSMEKLADIVDQSRFLFEHLDLEDEAREVLTADSLILRDAFIKELEDIDEVDIDFAKSIMKKLQKETGFKGKNLFMPTRAMISGNIHGPELSNIIEILGKEELLKRLRSISL